MMSVAAVKNAASRFAEQSRVAGYTRKPLVFLPEEFAEIAREPEPLRETICEAPEFVMGTPFDAKCLDGTHRRPVGLRDKVVRLVKNATIVGWRSVVSASGSLYMGAPISNGDNIDGVASLSSGQEGFAIQSVEGAKNVIYSNPMPREVYPGRGFFLTCLEPENYGSFLFRVLPKILLARDLDLRPDFIVVGERKPWALEALALAGFGGLPVLSATNSAAFVFADSMLIDDINFGDPFFDPLSRDRVQRLAEGAPGPREAAKLLYVSRRLAGMMTPGYRLLVNEREIEDHLSARRGASVVWPECYSFAAQMNLFMRAEKIVGPSGSGMLNAIFAKPGSCVVDIESYHVTVRQHARVYSSTGKRYGFVFGEFANSNVDENPARRAWRAAISDIDRALAHFT